MQARDIILAVRDGREVSEAEIRYLLQAYVKGEVPDYQISAWLMAVFFRGLKFEQIGWLTQAMIDSGQCLDLGTAQKPRIDKHSTGGVGDKVSLLLAPLVAECGLEVPMMSGRSLGHTGGTLDKLESIPGYRTKLDQAEFREILHRCGYAMCGQSEQVVPADRLLYALRDVTGTVESIPLITASILSKKFAEGAEGLVFDVKCGSGAFMKTYDEAFNLATSLVRSAEKLGKRASALITAMNFPLGQKVGNFLEIEETLACLNPDSQAWLGNFEGENYRFHGISADLMQVTFELAAAMLILGKIVTTRKEAFVMLLASLKDGRALERFWYNVKLQGGSKSEVLARVETYRAPCVYTWKAKNEGYLSEIDAYALGSAGINLGIGRAKTSDQVLFDVGFELHHAQGDAVKKGDAILTVYAPSNKIIDEIYTRIEAAITISPSVLKERTLLLGSVGGV